jgi:macrolide-specific efflux system membrane fusion protein
LKPALVVALAAVGVAVLGGGAWWALGGGRGSEAAPGAARSVAPTRRTVESSVIATGVVRLKVGAEVRVGAQVSGIVDELNVTVGSQVKQGDVLARIDSRGLRARLAQQRAQVAVIEREVERARVEQARVERLAERKLVAQSDVEDRRMTLAESEARLEKARRDAAVVETELDYAVIRAPIAGTVASVTTQKGETVATSFTAPTFVTIIGTDALQLVALVDETDIGSVTVGNPVTFTVEAWPAEEFGGRVERIAPKGTIISGVVNYEVMIAIDGKAALLKPDMTANISIRTAQREALVLPNEAVQRDGAERFVYVEENGRPVRREVTVGSRGGGYTEIRRGIEPKDRVLLGVEAPRQQP